MIAWDIKMQILWDQVDISWISRDDRGPRSLKKLCGGQPVDLLDLVEIGTIWTMVFRTHQHF